MAEYTAGGARCGHRDPEMGREGQRRRKNTESGLVRVEAGKSGTAVVLMSG